MKWNFQREESEPNYETVPVGKNRLRIKSAEMAVSKNGNDMLALQFDVSGCTAIQFHYITFLNDKPEITNNMLTSFFDSFGIEETDFNVAAYVGKVGGGQIKQDGEYTKVHYFLNKKDQEKLPDWSEEPVNLIEFEEVEVDDLPF